MERNLRLAVSYDGTEFHGWQSQPGLRTVQGELEDSLQRVLRHPVQLVASGRTDAGVHAVGQIANIHTNNTLPCSSLRSAFESRLSEDILIRAVTEVADNFHATQSACSKLYRYRIHNCTRRNVERFTQRYTYHFWHLLDVTRMREASRYFVGELDFSAMTAAGCERETMVRRVIRCQVVRRSDELVIDVEGAGFLYNQVRNMVGTLIEVGRGRWEPERVQTILASRDRSTAGPTAPAKGLCLQWVRYPPHLLRVDGSPGAERVASKADSA